MDELTKEENRKLGDLTDARKECPRKTNTGFRVGPLSSICLPPGTKIYIYVNVDPDDPDSDCTMEEVRISELDLPSGSCISAILVDSVSVVNIL